MARRHTTDEDKTKAEEPSLGTNPTNDDLQVSQKKFNQAMMEALKYVNEQVVEKRNVIARAKWNKGKGRREESH